MNVEILEVKVPSLDWDTFDPTTAHPANAVCFANMYREWLLSYPVFLEAHIGGDKASQWIIRRTRSKKLFATTIFTYTGPQVATACRDQYDDIFCQYIDFIKRKFSPRNITILNYALTRRISREALLRSGFERIEVFSSVINELTSDEKLLATFHTNHRINTRKAIKEQGIYSVGLSPEEYYTLSLKTYAASDVTGPRLSYIRSIQRSLVPHSKAFLSGVYFEGNLNAASIVLYHGLTGYYLHGASLPSNKHRGATTLLHFENMRHLRAMGIRYYDFGGVRLGEEANAKAHSISHFKVKFGGKLVELYGGSYR